jgi:MoaA/NifB/PqqE/SkfB family radical SAM enzyme
VLTTLSEYNSKSKYVLENICEKLVALTSERFRKWMVLVQLGMKDEVKQAVLMDRYTDFTTKFADTLWMDCDFEASFENESVAELPALKALAQEEKWDCYAGVLGCHIKANGDIYPCCLVGGEAVSTDAAFVIGNVHLTVLADLHRRYCNNMITDAYSCEACQAVCLYKQTKINQYAHAAKSIALAIP